MGINHDIPTGYVLSVFDVAMLTYATLPRNHFYDIARHRLYRFHDAIPNRFHATTFVDNACGMVK